MSEAFYKKIHTFLLNKKQYDAVNSWSSKESNASVFLFRLFGATAPEIDVLFEDGYGLIHICAGSRLHYALEYFLKSGADPNHRNQFGDTPLHTTTFISWSATALQLLLDYGADPTLLDGKGRTLEKSSGGSWPSLKKDLEIWRSKGKIPVPEWE